MTKDDALPLGDQSPMPNNQGKGLLVTAQPAPSQCLADVLGRLSERMGLSGENGFLFTV